MENTKITRKKYSDSPGVEKILFLDLVSYIYSVVPVVLSYMISIYIVSKIGSVLWLLFPVFFIVVFCMINRILRAPLKRLKAGVYPIENSGIILSWYAQNALNRSLRISGFKNLIFSMSWSRYLYLRSMGLSIPFRHNSSYDIIINDMELVNIGKGTTLAEKVEITPHTFLGEKLVLREVSIGNNCFIGRNSYLGPGTSIGNNCFIGMGNELLKKKLSEGTVLKNNEIKA